MPADFSNRNAQLDAGIEHPGAVKMKPQTMLISEFPRLSQVIQRKNLSILGVLQAQQPGSCKMRVIGFDVCCDLGQVQSTIVSKIQRLRLNTAEHRCAACLKLIRVGHLAYDVFVTALAVAEQCAQVGLRSARQEQRSLLTENFRRDFLQPVHGGVIAKHVIPYGCLSHRLAHGRSWSRHGVAA